MHRSRGRLPLLVLAGVLSAGGGAHAQNVNTQFGENKITYETFSWHVYESPHFDVHYYPASEPFLEDVVSHAESAYIELSKALDHELRFRVPLIIYKTHGEFQQTNVSLAELPEAVAAFAEPIQHRMVLPIDMPADELYELISHELVHIFQYSLFFEGYLGRALRSNIPTWLMEGMASYFAKDESTIDQMVIRDAVVNNFLPPIETLDQVTFLAYRFGHAVFDFIEEEHGLESVRSFLFEYRKVLLTNNLEKAVKEAFGYELDEFNRRFNRYLRRKYYPVLLEKKSPDDHGEEVGVKKPGVFTFSPNVSPSGELVAVLANPKAELDLLILSAEDGSTVKNLTKGWSNDHRGFVAEAFEGKRDLSWSPVADQVAVFARREQHWPLLVYDTIRGKKVRDIVFEDIVQCASPAFSPDGRRVAFEGNRNGIVDLFEVDLETRALRNLTQDDFFDANPWYSPDGKTLVYNRRIGESWKIFSVDLTDSSKKTQLTFGAYSEVQPSFSRDGSRIYFSSDRGEDRVFNIYGLDLATGDVEQFTDVVGGCFAPVEMAARNAERNLVFTSFFEGTFRLYRMPLLQAEREIDAQERLEEPLEAEPFEPPLTLRVDETAKHPYKLRWDIDAPSVTAAVADDGTFLAAAAVQFSDLLGNHRARILAYSLSDFSNYQGTYINLKRRFSWGATVYDFRDYFLRIDSGGGQERDEAYHNTGANGFIEYPFSRHYRVEGSVGFLDNSQALLVADPATGISSYQDFSDRFATFELGIVGDTTRFQSFGPFQGKRFRLGTLFGAHLSGDGEGDIVEHRLDFRAYKQLTRRSLLAFRAASIYNVGERENSYGFGGINQLRGFDFREFVGSRLAWSNVELRFPLIDELSFPVLRLGQIRGVFFLDAGAAWFQDDLWWDPELVGIRTGVSIKDRNDNGLLDAPDFKILDPIGFSWWDSDQDQPQDARVSYGVGVNFVFIGGLQFNWIWAKPLDYTQYVLQPSENDENVAEFRLGPVTVDGETQTEFYILYDW
jgi:hypothetical protein